MSEKTEPRSGRITPQMMMEQNSGYREIMARPEIRRKISEYILRAAKPELIGYTSVDDEIAKEFDIPAKTACRFLLGSRTKTVNFVFENLIKDDPAYVQFTAHKGFRDAFLQSMQKHNVTPMDYSDEYIQKVGNVVADMHERFQIDAALFAKYFLADTKLNKEVLDAANRR